MLGRLCFNLLLPPFDYSVMEESTQNKENYVLICYCPLLIFQQWKRVYKDMEIFAATPLFIIQRWKRVYKVREILF